MKIFSLLLIVFSTLASQASDKNKILWTEDYSLQWKDFTGAVRKTGSSNAMTMAGIAYDIKDDRPGVFAYFVKNESWYIKKTASDYLLRHEQYHFHLAELYARRLRKQIIEDDLTKDHKNLGKAFKDNIREFADAQKNYDKDTNHSLIAEEQARWEKEIDRQLAELKDYADPFVVK